MLELYAETTFNRTLGHVMGHLTNLDEIYTLYCPEEHIVCKYLKGEALEKGSILYFEEYIGGKKHKMKYVVVKSNDEKVILKARFPKSMFNIKVVFTVCEVSDKVHFSRKIQIGTKAPVIGSILDKLIIFLLGKKYYLAMIEHNEDDINKLKNYVDEFAR